MRDRISPFDRRPRHSVKESSVVGSDDDSEVGRRVIDPPEEEADRSSVPLPPLPAVWRPPGRTLDVQGYPRSIRGEERETTTFDRKTVDDISLQRYLRVAHERFRSSLEEEDPRGKISLERAKEAEVAAVVVVLVVVVVVRFP